MASSIYAIHDAFVVCHRPIRDLTLGNVAGKHDAVPDFRTCHRCRPWQDHRVCISNGRADTRDLIDLQGSTRIAERNITAANFREILGRDSIRKSY